MFQDIGIVSRYPFEFMKAEKISLRVSDSFGMVSAELMAPVKIDFLYVFAHGAGAGMSHPFMLRLATALLSFNIGTLRYNFPFVEKGAKRPDPPQIAEKTVIAAINAARDLMPRTPLLAGGKSFGGRMTSHALSKTPDTPVNGIIFVGFPLHAPGNAGISRAEHLAHVTVPMLFLQGTRDALADISLVEQVCGGLRSATLKKFEGADHSFKAGKQDLIPLLAEAISNWTKKLE